MKDKIIKIIFLNVFITILFIKDIHFENPIQKKKEIEINEKFSDAIYSYKEVTGRYPGYDNLQLNYENECSKYFKYRKNSKMDIVIFA